MNPLRILLHSIVFSQCKYTRNDIEIKFATNDSKNVPYIHCSYSNSTKYIVFAHGMATNIFKIYDSCKALCTKTKTNVIAFEYPGFTDLDKTPPSEQSCYDNIKIMINYMNKVMNIDNSNIYLVGYSLGTGIVADFIANNSWTSHAMLIAPYKTILSVVIKGSEKNEKNNNIDMFETIKKVDKIKCPVMIVHSEQDSIINIKHGKKIYEKLPNPLQPLWLTNLDHTDILNNIEEKEWRKFLQYE